VSEYAGRKDWAELNRASPDTNKSQYGSKPEGVDLAMIYYFSIISF